MPFPSADKAKVRRRGRPTKDEVCSCREHAWVWDAGGPERLGDVLTNHTLLFTGDSTVHNLYKVLERELSREGWTHSADPPRGLPFVCTEWALGRGRLRLCIQRIYGTMPFSPQATASAVAEIQSLQRFGLSVVVTGPSVHYVKGGRGIGEVPSREPGGEPESLGVVADPRNYLAHVLRVLPPGVALVVREAEPQGFPGEPHDGLYRGWEGFAGSKNELAPGQLQRMGLNLSELRGEHYRRTVNHVGGGSCTPAALQAGGSAAAAGRVVNAAFEQALAAECAAQQQQQQQPRVVLLRTRSPTEDALATGAERWWGFKFKVPRGKSAAKAGRITAGVLDCVHMRCGNVHRMQLQFMARALRHWQLLPQPRSA